KRIRCRQCGNVFTVPAPEVDPDDTSALNSLAELEHSQAGESMLSGTVGGSFVGEEGPQDLPEGGVAPRRTVRLSYRYAVGVDRWLPVLVLVGGLLWVILTVIYNNETQSGGIAAARIVVLLLCYVAILCPLALKGVQMAGRDIGFMLPRGQRVRA